MGNYIARTDVENVMAPSDLADFFRTTVGSAEYVSRLTGVIAGAESRVDSYLEAAYAVPVTASGFVKEAALVFVRYDIAMLGDGGNIPQKLRDMYADMLVDLRAVADGTRSIGGASTGGGVGSTSLKGVGMIVSADEGIFTAARMSGW